MHSDRECGRADRILQSTGSFLKCPQKSDVGYVEVRNHGLHPGLHMDGRCSIIWASFCWLLRLVSKRLCWKQNTLALISSLRQHADIMRGYLIHCVTIPAAQDVFSLLFMYKECDLFMYLFICYQIKHLIIIILDKKD